MGVSLRRGWCTQNRSQGVNGGAASDAIGQALAYVYYEQEPGRRSAAHLLIRDEAWRIALNIAKLPELLTKP